MTPRILATEHYLVAPRTAARTSPTRDACQDGKVPYGSAADLPKIREMRQSLSVMRLFGLFLSRADRAKMKEVRIELSRLTRTVDEFYALLGPRNWVFHEDLSLPDMERIVRGAKGDAGDAEATLIEWYGEGDRLDWMVRRLSWHQAWRARRELLEHALDDYRAGRFYAVVQVLLSVMDGFVNDLYPEARKALHAREPDEMDAWNSVVGHHEGLTAVMKTYQRTIKARIDDPVYELYRHGIVHGMVVNYDNAVVATKAWNTLFAVSDWARSLQEMAKEALKPPTPPLRETMTRYAETQELKKVIEAFQPFTLRPEDAAFDQHDATKATAAFLEDWKARRWGLIPGRLSDIHRNVGPADVRQEMEQYALDSYSIVEVNVNAAALCLVRVELVIDGMTYRPKLRWTFQGSDGGVAVAGHSTGEWRLVWWQPTMLMRPPDPEL